MVAILLAACAPGPDPALIPTARALEAWKEGEGMLERGDAQGAARRFAEASAASPSPLLSAWEAKAAADGGDLEGAIAHFDRALEAAPAFAQARYNKAAYLARLGRVDAAAVELQRALDDGARPALEVLEDPDFGPYLTEPAFQFLPRQPLSVAVEAPSGSVFWGAEVALRLRLIGLVRDPVRVAVDRFEGPLQLQTVIEDDVPTSQGPSRDLSYTWKVVGAGPIVLGPTRVGAGKYWTQIAPIELTAEAPPDVAIARGEALVLPTAHEVIDELPPRSAALVRARGRESVAHWVVRADPGDRVATDPPLPSPARFELRSSGEAVQVGLRWPVGPTPVKVTLRDPHGDLLWEGTLDTAP